MLRIALVGAGRMGREHLAALASSTEVRITDVVDPDALALQRLDGVGARLHASLADLLAGPAPDAVLVASPTPSHNDIVREAVGAGLPVLCEKPAAMTLAELDELSAQAAARDVPVRVGYWRRHVPALRDLRGRLQRHELGTVYTVLASQWDEAPPPAVFRATSGGIVVDMGVHEIDQICWLSDDEVVEVHATAACHVEDPEVDTDADVAVIVLRMRRGAIGVIRLGRYHNGGDLVEAEVHGVRGHVRVTVLGPGARATFHDALRHQAASFADAVRGRLSACADLDDARRALRVAVLAQEAISIARDDARCTEQRLDATTEGSRA